MCVSRMTAGCQGGCFSGNRKMGGAQAARGADGISGETAKGSEAPCNAAKRKSKTWRPDSGAAQSPEASSFYPELQTLSIFRDHGQQDGGLNRTR